MSTNFKTYENPSIFHRWAAAQWRRPKDPTIYGATEIDMEPALAFVDKVREEWGVNVTVTHLVAKALAIAIARHPETNAKVRFWGKLEQRKTVDITVLIAGAGGRDLSAHPIIAMHGVDEAYAPLTPIGRIMVDALLTRIRPRPWVGEDGELGVRPTLKLCATFDHRVVDGVQAARLCQELRTSLADPDSLR